MTDTIPGTTGVSTPDALPPAMNPSPMTAATVNAPVPNQAGARDILVYRGAEFWPTPEDVIREVHAQGLSVRIPRNNIPEGMVKGLSRIALAHIKAVLVIEKGTVEDLRAAFEALHDEAIDRVLARPYEHAASRWLEIPESQAKREIFERLGVSFKPGIFAFCYWTGTSYYLKPEEKDTPEDLARKGVKPVRGVAAATGQVITPDMAEMEDAEAASMEGEANG